VQNFALFGLLIVIEREIMTARDMTSMRAEGHSSSMLVTPTAPILRDEVIRRTGVTSATNTTITNKDLTQPEQRAFVGVEACTLHVINHSGATVTVGYTFTPTFDGVAVGTPLTGSVAALASTPASAFADLVSDEIKYADGYTLNYTASATANISIYLVKLGQN